SEARASIIARVALEQMASNQRADPLNDIRSHSSISIAHRLRRLDRASAHKHAQPPKEPLIGWGKQIVAPVDRMPERREAQRQIARAASEQCETIIQPRQHFMWREQRSARRR